MAFPDSNWPCGGDYLRVSFFTSKVWINWTISKSFLCKCKGERNNLKSDGFAHAGAIWNLFATFDGKGARSLFGINVRGRSPLDSVLDCYCDIKFTKYSGADKSIIIKFKCGSGDSYCAAENFLSKSELDTFLNDGHEIDCQIVIKDLKEITNNPMVFPDSTWPCGGDDLKVAVYAPEEGNVTWTIKSFLSECLVEKHELRSEDFSFAGTTWNFFASFDQSNIHSLFGISVREYGSSDTALDCCCTIAFKETALKTMKHIVMKLKCESANSQCTVEDFFTQLPLIAFLTEGAQIVCRISVKKSSLKKASTQAETQLQENKDEEIPKIHPTFRVCQDFKNLLLSEEGSDVTIQVRDQQFRAHRYILSARSSVFACMFRHDTKERTTGVVNVEDCDPFSFTVLLEFLYCGSVEKISIENMFSVCTAADKYDVQDLKIECLEFMTNNLSVETFCDTLRLSLMHSETNLLKLSTNFLARNMKKIVKTAKWKRFKKENPDHANEILTKALAANSILLISKREES